MYRTIDTAIWTDPKIRKLPADAKLLFVYLITNSHTHVSGIYYLPVPVAAHETTLEAERVNTLLHTILTPCLVLYDDECEVVWVKKMLDRQGKGNRNDRAAAQQLSTLHNCKLIKDFLQFYSHRKIPYRIGHSVVVATCSKEQEQEQDLLSLRKKQRSARSEKPLNDIQVISSSKHRVAFLEFWATYPFRNGRRIGRAEAIAEFVKLSEEDLPAIIQATRNLAADPGAKQGVGVKDAQRWIRKPPRGPGDAPWRDWVGAPQPALEVDAPTVVSFKKAPKSCSTESSNGCAGSENHQPKLTPMLPG